VDDMIGDLELLTNPTVGLLAHPGQVDIRITAKADSVEEADRLIAGMEATVRERMGDAIFGADSDTLEDELALKLGKLGWEMAALECNLGGELRARLAKAGLPEERVQIENAECTIEGLEDRAAVVQEQMGSGVMLAAALRPGQEKQSLLVYVRTPHGDECTERSYGGPPALGVSWAVHTALDFLRRKIGKDQA